MYAVEVLEDGGCLCSAVGHNGLITNDKKVSQKYISTLVSNQDFNQHVFQSRTHLRKKILCEVLSPYWIRVGIAVQALLRD